MTTTQRPGERQEHRRAALLAVLLGAGAFAAIAVALVPWDALPSTLPAVSADSVLGPGEIDRAEHFSRWARGWSWSALVVSLAVLCWFGFTRHGRALVDRLPGPWWGRVVLAVAVVNLVVRVVTLPLSAARRQLLIDHGLTTQSWFGYGLDVVKGELVDVAVTSLLLVMLVGVARRWRRWWPLLAGATGSVLVLLGSFVYPLVVEPLFNDFTPLPSGTLRSEVLALADREGVAVDEVLVADASRRTTTLNAYVSGFAGTRRVVLYDTLVDGVPRDQALSVVAHELAHARYDDVLVGTGMGAAGAVLAFGVLGLLTGRSRRPGGDPGPDPGGRPRPGVRRGLGAAVAGAGGDRLAAGRAGAACDQPHGGGPGGRGGARGYR